jgi:hypothetical protein
MRQALISLLLLAVVASAAAEYATLFEADSATLPAVSNRRMLTWGVGHHGSWFRRFHHKVRTLLYSALSRLPNLNCRGSGHHAQFTAHFC